MSKTIEENWRLIKRLLWEIGLYCKFMCTDENNNKHNKNKTTPPLPYTPVTVFIIAEKLLSL